MNLFLIVALLGSAWLCFVQFKEVREKRAAYLYEKNWLVQQMGQHITPAANRFYISLVILLAYAVVFFGCVCLILDI